MHYGPEEKDEENDKDSMYGFAEWDRIMRLQSGRILSQLCAREFGRYGKSLEGNKGPRRSGKGFRD